MTSADPAFLADPASGFFALMDGDGLIGYRSFAPRQTWWLLARDGAALPPPAFPRQLTGPTLAVGFERSWRTG